MNFSRATECVWVLDLVLQARANGNQVIDSQKNDRDGYNIGKSSYYVGANIGVDWTRKYGAGTYQMKDTEFVLQYACGTLIRDGSSTTTIPERPIQCANFDCDTDIEYGRHESWTDYMYCREISRSKGKNFLKCIFGVDLCESNNFDKINNGIVNGMLIFVFFYFFFSLFSLNM